MTILQLFPIKLINKIICYSLGIINKLSIYHKKKNFYYNFHGPKQKQKEEKSITR